MVHIWNTKETRLKRAVQPALAPAGMWRLFLLVTENVSWITGEVAGFLRCSLLAVT